MRRKRLGQHYLVDSGVITRIVEAAKIGRNERVLEIGSGRGALTLALCKLTRRLDAYELDEENYWLTKEKVRDFKEVRILHKDVFKANPKFDVLVSSLPYSESSTFVEWLSKKTYSRAIVILQEEFVEKLMAAPKARSYRAISAISQISSTISVEDRVKRDSFDPQPRVNSLLVTIEPKVRLSDDVIDAIKKLFSLKKRKLRTALKILGLKSSFPVKDEMEERIQEIPSDRLYRVVQVLRHK